MKDYVNKFAVAISAERSEVMLTFIQEGPDLAALGMVQPGDAPASMPSRTTQETAADLIMSERSARKLAQMILETLERSGSGAVRRPVTGKEN